MPRIFRRLQDSLIVIQGEEGSPFAQDRVRFFASGATDISIRLDGEEIDIIPFGDVEQEDGSPAGGSQAAVLVYLDAQLLPVQGSRRLVQHRHSS